MSASMYHRSTDDAASVHPIVVSSSNQYRRIWTAAAHAICGAPERVLRGLPQRLLYSVSIAGGRNPGYSCSVMQTLVGKTALVTGAGSGIGRAIARRLAAEGACVAAADINLAAAHQTQDWIREASGHAMAVDMDVAVLASVRDATRRVHDELGRIDILVNNAGWDRVEPFVQNAPALWDRLIDVNLKGPIYCCRAVLDDMIAARGGKIISISSDAARVGSTGEAVYAACKGGIISLSKTLARELARHNITVNVVCPGPTKTALLDEVTQGEQGAKIIAAMTRAIPFRRLGEPEEVAAAVAFFAAADADFITGQVLSVSGGLTMAG
jgi:2-hydroxycyclohexanecarboxyl-CoA dehydrogenase